MWPTHKKNEGHWESRGLPNTIKNLKKLLESSLSKSVDSYKVESLREAVGLLSKAGNLSQDLDSGRDEIYRLIARALTLADNVGAFDG